MITTIHSQSALWKLPMSDHVPGITSSFYRQETLAMIVGDLLIPNLLCGRIKTCNGDDLIK